MRTLILIAAAALSLGACRNNDQADNTMNVDENLSAENIVSNDITAIDAVTGADANMAAAAEVNDVGLDNSDGSDLNTATGNSLAPTSKAPAKKRSAAPTPTKPTTNAMDAPASGNAQ